MGGFRQWDTATLLLNGKVLVAGGGAANHATASAELYDPASGTWSPTGAMATARFSHTATLLPSGKVLVAGGLDNGNVIASSELYDPATGTWSTTGSMGNARLYHTATLLLNGKVLVAGGLTLSAGSGFTLTGSAELYDPASGTWSVTASMAYPRYVATATLLQSGVQNGKVVMVGGGFLPPELYDPAASTWSAAGTMTSPTYSHTATVLQSGQLLVAGGSTKVWTPSTLTARAELYTPPTGALVPAVRTRIGSQATLPSTPPEHRLHKHARPHRRKHGRRRKAVSTKSPSPRKGANHLSHPSSSARS
jgi:Kelch motif/Galactose oxidase, central domain